MLKKIDHIGIAVHSADEAAEKFRAWFEMEPSEAEVVESQGVRVRMIQVGESLIELLEPIVSGGPIGTFLEKRGEGIHHVAFGVEGIGEKLACLKARGVQLINEEPVDGAHHKLIGFLHPKALHSVLVELCERKK